MRNSDFEEIYQGFVKRYGRVEGEANYELWLSIKGLDESKPYAQPKKNVDKERFSWDFVSEVELVPKRPVPLFRFTPVKSEEKQE